MKKTPSIEDDNVISLDEARKHPVPKVDFRGPDGIDWLSSMVPGTEFLCRDKTGRTPRWLVIDYTHLGKLKGNVWLSPTVTVNDARTWFWVDPVAFCREWEFRGVVEEHTDE